MNLPTNRYVYFTLGLSFWGRAGTPKAFQRKLSWTVTGRATLSFKILSNLLLGEHAFPARERSAPHVRAPSRKRMQMSGPAFRAVFIISLAAEYLGILNISRPKGAFPSSTEIAGFSLRFREIWDRGNALSWKRPFPVVSYFF